MWKTPISRDGELNREWVIGSDGEENDEREYDQVDQKTGEPLAPRFYDWHEDYPELQLLLDNIDVIQAEINFLQESRWFSWPENKLYNSLDQNGLWKVVPFLHTFPAYDVSKMRFIENNCKAMPKTMELLQRLPGLRTVLLSRLGPRTRLSSHQGWCDLANYVLRVHLPLVVPRTEECENCCGVVVEGEIQYHKENDFVVFDDSKYHKAFNAADSDRIVLIFDLMRPEKYPKGTAVRGHTRQLDQFIDQYENMLADVLS